MTTQSDLEWLIDEMLALAVLAEQTDDDSQRASAKSYRKQVSTNITTALRQQYIQGKMDAFNSIK